MELVIYIDPIMTEHEYLSAVQYVEKRIKEETGKRPEKIRIYDKGKGGVFPFAQDYYLIPIGKEAWGKYLAGDFAEPQASVDARENERKGNHR